MTAANLRSKVRFLVFGDSTNTAYSDTDIDSNIEEAKLLALSWVIETNGDWQIKGEVAVTDLVADQTEYPLPTDLVKHNAIRVKTTSTSDYVIPKRIDSRNIADRDTYKPLQPEYDYNAESLFIWLPDGVVDVTDGIEIEYQLDEAVTLPEMFERLSYFYASYMYCLAKEKRAKANDFARIIGLDQTMVDSGIKKEIKNWVANRSTTEDTVLKPELNNYY